MHRIPSPDNELRLLKISVERSSDEVFWLDFEGNILYANEAASRITGYSPEELCSMKIADLDTEIPPGAWEASVADLREKKTRFITSRHQCKDGRFIDVEILAVYVNSGELEYSFAFVRDITERRKMEESLRESERKYRLLAENVHDVIWATGRDMHFTYISPSVTALRGLTPEEAMAESFQDALTPDSCRALMESRERGLEALKNGSPVSRNIVMELEFRCRDGSTVWTDMAITPVLDDNGMPAGAAGIIRNSTRRREMEKTLRESHAKLRTVLDNLPDLVLVHRDGIIRYVNPAMTNTMGFAPGDVLNKSILDFVPEVCHARVATAINRRMENGWNEPYEIELLSSARGRRDVLIRGAVIDFDGSPAVLNVLTDITVQKRAEEELRKSRQMLAEAMELANLVNWEYDVAKGLFTFTDRFYALYGTTAAREGSTLMPADVYAREFVHPEDRGIVDEEVKKALAATDPGYVSQREHRIIRRDGAIRYIVVRIAITKDADGNTVGIHGANQDITERRAAEEARRESEEKYRELVENANSIILKWDKSGNISFFNEFAQRFFGYSEKEILGKPVLGTIVPDTESGSGRDLQQLIQDIIRHPQDHALNENENITRDGRRVWIRWQNKPLFDENGQFAGQLSVGIDNTGRKKAEEALARSEELYRILAEESPDQIFTISRDGIIRYVNSAAIRSFNLPGDRIIGKKTRDVFPPDISRSQERALETVFGTGVRLRQEQLIRFGNQEYWFDTNLVPLKDPAGNVTSVLGIAHDITESKIAEKALRESEEKFRSYVENANDIIYSLSAGGMFTYVSPKWTELLGHDAAEVIGKTVDSFIHPDDLPACHEFVRQVLMQGEKKSGIEYRIRHRDGTWQWHTTTASPIRDEAGNTISFLGICRDITERRRAEDALRSANRQLTLLTGITRHDILNKVSVILGFLSIAEKKAGSPDAAGYLKKIHAATEAIRSQIEFTRVYENLGTHEPQWIDLDGVMPRNQVPAPLTLDADVKGVQVLSDPMLEKVFFNLLDNSIRHGQRVTRIRVSAHSSGDDLVVVWEDNGVGIAPDEKEQIFERGFGKNTGLGMFLVREILTLTGITIAETGEPGKGARFEIRVPKGVFRISGSQVF